MAMGPVCGMVLADLGADVIKVEPPPDGDKSRRLTGIGLGFFATFNRNKRSVCVDVEHPSGLFNAGPRSCASAESWSCAAFVPIGCKRFLDGKARKVGPAICADRHTNPAIRRSSSESIGRSFADCRRLQAGQAIALALLMSSHLFQFHSAGSRTTSFALVAAQGKCPAFTWE